MNYREYQEWSLKRAPDALWLGELDVFKVMGPLSAPPYNEHLSPELVLSKWSERSGWDSGDKAAKITTGVRDGLGCVWEALKTRVANIWIPSDVYPVYSEIFSTSQTYELMPNQWLDDLLRKVDSRDAILLPAPLHPIGRHLSKGEESKVLAWLESNPEAWLLVDTAYDYGKWSLPHDRCITLRTMSKSWLCRRMFGIVEARTDLIAALNTISPNEGQLKYCYGMLDSQNLPVIQQGLFTQAWLNIQDQLHDLQIEFTPPVHGILNRRELRSACQRRKDSEHSRNCLWLKTALQSDQLPRRN